MKMKSVMQHAFSQIPDVNIPRSKFNRSHGLKTTFNSGYLVPIFVDEALPGDTFNLNLTAFARMATPLKPIMDNLKMDFFFFAVPIRLIWEHWANLNGEKVNPDDTQEYLVPQMTAPDSTGYTVGSLSDYLGLPTGMENYKHSALWHRAYNLIYNEWFRDQNLIDSVVVDKGDAESDPDDYVLLRRGKRHDYFTSCLPWPQKGESVLLPLGDYAPVKGIGKLDQTWDPGSQNVYESGGSGVTTYATKSYITGTSHQEFLVEQDPENLGFPRIRADLAEATASTINALREAFQIQRMLERDARGGTRYIEIIRAHFGVTSPDYRLQRPEYLGGGTVPVNVSPVAQNSATGATGTPQGNLAGFATATGRVGFTKSFTEHCVLLGLVNVRADLTYQQGLDRMWSRRTRYDFYWPSLANLGEQTVLTKEIYCQGPTVDTGSTGTPDNEKVFGYQERYAEYRYKPSKITGKFRSTAAGTLHVWHLAQEFSGIPTLDQTFIEENPPMSRIMAVPSEPEFIYDSYADLICVRPMPTYSVPGMIDHF